MLNIKLPRTRYKKGVAPDYPNLEDRADGAPIPIAYGDIHGIIPVCIDINAHTYKIACHAIHSIDAVRDDTEVLNPIYYTPDLAVAEFSLLSTPYLTAGVYYFVIDVDCPVDITHHIHLKPYDIYADGSLWTFDSGTGLWTQDGAHDLRFWIFGRDTLDGPETIRIFNSHQGAGSHLTYDLKDVVARDRIAQSFTVVGADFYCTRIQVWYRKWPWTTAWSAGNIRVAILSSLTPEVQVDSGSLDASADNYGDPFLFPLRAETSALYCDIEGAERIGMWVYCSSVDATAATVQVTAATIILVITGGVNDGTNTLTFADSDKNTLNELVAFINTLPGWEAGALPDGSTASTDLNIVPATACLGIKNELALKLPTTIVDGADMLEDLVATHLKKSLSILDPTELANFKAKRTQEIAAYIDSDNMTCGDVVGKLEASLLFKLVPLQDGTYAPIVYEADDSGDIRPHLFDEHFLSFSMRRNFSAVKTIIKVKYNENPGNNEFKVAEAESLVARFVYGMEETLEVETYLSAYLSGGISDGTDAEDLAESYLSMYETPPIEITFEVRGYGLDLIPGKDKVRITRTRAPYKDLTLSGSPSGELNDVLFRIIKLTKKPGTDTTEIVAVLDTQTY